MNGLVSYFQALVHNVDVPEYRKNLTVRAWQYIIGRDQVSYRETSLLLGALRKIGLESQEGEEE